VKAIQETCRLSEQAAWNQLKRYYDDLAPPSLDVGDFADAWRTPSVVELARTMYESSDFSGMPRLAEALVRAGCGHQVVLDHCRDKQATHIRRCWLLDAILQDWIATRSSTGKKPDAASRGGGRKKSLLSKVSKRGRDEIARIMEERDGHLPLEDFLAKRWDVMGFCKSASHFDERAANRITEWQSELAQLHPEWSVDQVQTVMSLARLTANLREVAIARRLPGTSSSMCFRWNSLAGYEIESQACTRSVSWPNPRVATGQRTRMAADVPHTGSNREQGSNAPLP